LRVADLLEIEGCYEGVVERLGERLGDDGNISPTSSKASANLKWKPSSGRRLLRTH
jgi:hypothetical protein